MNNFNFSDFWTAQGTYLIISTVQHIWISLLAVFLGALVAIPLGIWLTRHESLARYVMGTAGMIQTVPSLAFFGFVLPIFGVGVTPALFVLFLYSLLPILRNTFTGIKEVSPSLLEAGKGMGMGIFQILFMVELPLALPVIMAGVRISTVYIISWATLAALIGAGGLGDPIFTGISTYDTSLIIAGAVPAALLALTAGWLFSFIEKLITPRGLKA